MRTFTFAALAAILAPVLAAPPAKLRYENITDIEVQEIQSVMAGRIPGATIVIGSVTDECDCHEGLACTNQVWVVSHQPGKDIGIYLSKIDGHWDLGPYEKWQDEYDALVRRMSDPPADMDYRAERERLRAVAQTMPRCPKNAASLPVTSAASRHTPAASPPHP
jgi:hypothetical protein